MPKVAQIAGDYRLVAKLLDINHGVSTDRIVEMAQDDKGYRFLASGANRHGITVNIRISDILRALASAGFAVYESRNGKPMGWYRVNGWRISPPNEAYPSRFPAVRIP